MHMTHAHEHDVCAHTHTRQQRTRTRTRDTYTYTCASALRQADNWESDWRSDVRAPNGERWRFPGGSRAMIGKHACHDPRKVRKLLSTWLVGTTDPSMSKQVRNVVSGAGEPSMGPAWDRALLSCNPPTYLLTQ